jgi:hypothetical protein
MSMRGWFGGRVESRFSGYSVALALAFLAQANVEFLMPDNAKKFQADPVRASTS